MSNAQKRISYANELYNTYISSAFLADDPDPLDCGDWIHEAGDLWKLSCGSRATEPEYITNTRNDLIKLAGSDHEFHGFIQNLISWCDYIDSQIERVA